MFTHPWTADVPMTTNQATIGRIRPPIVGGFGPDATFQADDAATVGVTFDGVAEAHLYGADVRATGVRRDRRQRRGRRPQSGARVPAGSREPRWGAPGVPGCGHHGWVVDHRNQPESPATAGTGEHIQGQAPARGSRGAAGSSTAMAESPVGRSAESSPASAPCRARTVRR